MEERACPGCGLEMPIRDGATYDGYFHASPECWNVFTEVIGEEFQNPGLFGRAHQLTVDAYAVQHAGGPHPDKSVDIHLVGLCLVLEHGLPPPSVAPHLQRLADEVATWPHLEPPEAVTAPTILNVALSDTHDEHIATVRAWAEAVWASWSPHHDAVAALAQRTVDRG